MTAFVAQGVTLQMSKEPAIHLHVLLDGTRGPDDQFALSTKSAGKGDGERTRP